MNLGLYWLNLLVTGLLMTLAVALTRSTDQLAWTLLLVMVAAWVPVVGTARLRAI